MEQDNDKDLFKGMKWIGLGGAFLAALILVLFLLNQTYNTDLPVDTGIFGTYGDFIGGVLGTVVALYSTYLLIRTFQNQAKINEDVKTTNASVVKTNDSIIAANTKAEAAAQRQYYQTELQIFDGKFSRFFDAYQRAVGAYVFEPNNNGRAAFEVIAKLFIGKEFEHEGKYKPRCESATDDYLEFYADHQTEMSVHLRTLYLLVRLISRSNLEEDDKVQYAKLVRGQMSNAEMLLVRYNCRSHYGEKMRNYCNQYNLTKHLSITRLLEFKSYRKTIEEASEESDKLLSGLDVMFISLRKKATKLLYDGNKLSDEFKTSHRYIIKLDFSAFDKQSFTLELQNNKDVERRGIIRVSPDEKALDCLSDDQVINMFKDFLNELFIFSNFEQYNEGAEIKAIGTPVKNDKELRFGLRVTNTKRLVLSHIQMENRDNPVGVLE